MIIRLSLEDIGVSKQIVFISGHSLHQLSEHILQDLTITEIQCRQTDTDYYN